MYSFFSTCSLFYFLCPLLPFPFAILPILAIFFLEVSLHFFLMFLGLLSFIPGSLSHIISSLVLPYFLFVKFLFYLSLSVSFSLYFSSVQVSYCLRALFPFTLCFPFLDVPLSFQYTHLSFHLPPPPPQSSPAFWGVGGCSKDHILDIDNRHLPHLFLILFSLVLPPFHALSLSL